jgi:uroporphyrinogen-III synthase
MRKTILLLRAADDAARSAAELQKRGHRLVLSPVIEIVPTGLPLPEAPFDGVIATSAQAFKFMPREGADQLRTLPLFCVGSRGALAALRLGFPQAQVIAPDAKSLTPQIIAKLPPPAHFLYLAGEDRKPDLENDLAAAQFQVTIHEIYSAEAAEKLTSQALAALEDRTIDAVLHYSRRSVEIFLSLAEAADVDLSRPAHFCLSADCAAPLTEAGLPHVFVAETPNETALLSKLTRFSLS